VLKEVEQQAPKAVCELVPANSSTNLLVNRDARPFDNADLRRALALALDRKSFIDILAQGQGDIGGAMEPTPSGVWGMPAGILATVPGYDPDVAKNRAAAREVMAQLGYGPDKHLAIKVTARNIPTYRDPAVILIDQLKEIWIDAELDAVETANWFPKLARKDYQIGVNNTGSGVDDPDQQFFENYGCGSERNYTGYCNKELEALFVEQSTTTDQDKRKRLVWEIDKKLQEDGARPIVYHTRLGTCMQPQLKGLTVMVNSQYNGWRMEDVWLDR
jgi:peptide/nickel transport system substrate-binding protein